MENSEIFCPLVEGYVSIVDCMENRDIKEEFIPEQFKIKSNWKDICNNCPYNKM
jgi:hypothetical protein